MLNRMLKQMRQRRAARVCATQGHVVPQETTDRLRQAYLGGNLAPFGGVRVPALWRARYNAILARYGR